MSLGYSTALRNAQLDAISTAVGSAGTIKIYDGTRPATGGTATTLLGTFTFAGAFAPASSAGVLTPNTPPATTGLAASTATWYRIATSGSTQVIDGGAGASVVTTITGSSGAATITVGSNTGLIVGQYASGTGIATGAIITNINGTTVTLSINNSGAVSGNGTFQQELTLNTAAITVGVNLTITGHTITAGNI